MYPSYLNDQHDNFHLVPVHQEIQRDLLSPYQNNLADDLGVKVGGEKLCLMLEDKKKCICHYRNLKLYLEKGHKLTRIRRVLRFKQSAWLKRGQKGGAPLHAIEESRVLWAKGPEN